MDHAGSSSAREARSGAIARLSHPNVVRVYDGGVDDGVTFSVMELLEGEDLARRLARVGRLSLVDMLALAETGWSAITGRPAAEARADGSVVPPSRFAPEVGPLADELFTHALAPEDAARRPSARDLAIALSQLGSAAAATRATQILVVDDEPDAAALIRQLFRRKIRDGTYDFRFAGNGLEALRDIEAHAETDVVLCDINMPQMDGLTFLEKARALDPLRRVVMVSAYGDMQNIRSAMNRGAFDFVTKPIDRGDLEATIHKAAVEVGAHRDAIRRWADAERARRNLARYFAPGMVDILASSDAPMRTANRADVGVLFADMVGFTTLAEAMAPEDVLALLREFHDRMETEVYLHRGNLEKYIGDALLATFGVPTPSGRDATLALACGRAMLRALAGLNEARAARGEAPIRMGIGVHWGPAVLGDLGKERNAAFVVIGDTVNTGSRLQSATRDLGASLVVSQDLLAAVARETGEESRSLVAGLVDLGERPLRGRQRPMHVWALTDDRVAETPAPASVAPPATS